MAVGNFPWTEGHVYFIQFRSGWSVRAEFPEGGMPAIYEGIASDITHGTRIPFTTGLTDYDTGYDQMFDEGSIDYAIDITDDPTYQPAPALVSVDHAPVAIHWLYPGAYAIGTSINVQILGPG